MHRVVPGAYVNAHSWSGLSARERYVARVHAVVSRLTGFVAASHWSAAAIWGFPVPSDWPRDVQIIDPRRGKSNRIATLHRRPGELLPGDTAAWEGITVTTPARTAADLALISSFDEAVMVFDHGLRVAAFTKAEVSVHLDRRPTARRRTSARAALDFASPQAEWPGESFSRAGMMMSGLQDPALQHPLSDSGGLIGYVDFAWLDVGVIGEFDGQWKYTDPRYMRGRTAAEVIRDEKRRHARLEAHPEVERIVRWDYPVARDPDELARRLLAAGVPRARRSRRTRAGPAG
jgi:hypothetical protein